METPTYSQAIKTLKSLRIGADRKSILKRREHLTWLIEIFSKQKRSAPLSLQDHDQYAAVTKRWRLEGNKTKKRAVKEAKTDLKKGRYKERQARNAMLSIFKKTGFMKDISNLKMTELKDGYVTEFTFNILAAEKRPKRLQRESVRGKSVSAAQKRLKKNLREYTYIERDAKGGIRKTYTKKIQ